MDSPIKIVYFGAPIFLGNLHVISVASPQLQHFVRCFCISKPSYRQSSSYSCFNFSNLPPRCVPGTTGNYPAIIVCSGALVPQVRKYQRPSQIHVHLLDDFEAFSAITSVSRHVQTSKRKAASCKVPQTVDGSLARRRWADFIVRLCPIQLLLASMSASFLVNSFGFLLELLRCWEVDV